MFAEGGPGPVGEETMRDSTWNVRMAWDLNDVVIVVIVFICGLLSGVSYTRKGISCNSEWIMNEFVNQ